MLLAPGEGGCGWKWMEWGAPGHRGLGFSIPFLAFPGAVRELQVSWSHHLCLNPKPHRLLHSEEGLITSRFLLSDIQYKQPRFLFKPIPIFLTPALFQDQTVMRIFCWQTSIWYPTPLSQSRQSLPCHGFLLTITP